jgi:hypothetical protein
MQIKTALSRIRKYRPTTPKDFAWAGVPLEDKALGTGAFREVVKVKDCDLVVKFPLNEPEFGKLYNYRWGKLHSTAEVKKIARLSKLPWMRKYLPKIYYHDHKSGVLVMRYYPPFTGKYSLLGATGILIRDLFKRATGENMCDYGAENVHDRGDMEAVIIDWGY